MRQQINRAALMLAIDAASLASRRKECTPLERQRNSRQLGLELARLLAASGGMFDPSLVADAMKSDADPE